MQRICFRVDLPAERFRRYYQGAAQTVQVEARDGRRIQLPAINLRPFLSPEGVHGSFELILDNNNKLLKISKII